MSHEPLNFELITDEERNVLNSDLQMDILALFEAAINSSSDPKVDQKAESFVGDLVVLASKESVRFDAGIIAAATWKVIINIASCIPVQHYGQDVLVKIVSLLGIAGDIWKDYPGFGMLMRDNWSRSKYHVIILESCSLTSIKAPTFQLSDDDDDGLEFTLNEWLNLNSFVAKLGSDFISFGLWELRTGLEGVEPDETTTPEAVANTRILVATQWVIHGGRTLLRKSLLNALSEEPSSGRPWRGGPLFPGIRGFNLERWGFWKRRFGELRVDAREFTKEQIDQAVEVMRVIETEVAGAWVVT